MSFTIENEKQNRMSFLDVQIIREDKAFTIFDYRKSTFSGVYINFDTFFTVYLKVWSCLQTRLQMLANLLKFDLITQ